MLQPRALAHIRSLGAYLRANANRLVIDADTHASDLSQYQQPRPRHYYHGRPLSLEELVAEMDMAGVDMANTWQNPAATHYPGGEDENAEALLAANRYLAIESRRFPHRFLPSGWTDPRACGVANAIRIAETCVQDFGFLFVKLNPAQNRYPIDSPEVLAVVDRIVSLGAIPAFHYGADTPFTPASGLEALAIRCQPHPILAVHMGGGGAGYVEAEEQYQQSRALGLRYPNIRYVFSALRDTHIEEALIAYQAAGAPYCENLFCASDAPYGRMSWNFGGFRQLFASLADPRHPDPRVHGLFGPSAAAPYLGGNFAHFVLAGYDHLLKKFMLPPLADLG